MRAMDEVTSARADGGCVHVLLGPRQTTPCAVHDLVRPGPASVAPCAPICSIPHFWRAEQRLAEEESASAGLKT